MVSQQIKNGIAYEEPSWKGIFFFSLVCDRPAILLRGFSPSTVDLLGSLLMRTEGREKGQECKETMNSERKEHLVYRPAIHGPKVYSGKRIGEKKEKDKVYA